MGIQLILREGTLTAFLSGDIDDHTAREMREAIDTSAEKARPRRLELNFADVTFMDSSGIGLIMGRYKLAQIWGGQIILSDMPHKIEHLVRLSGADKLAKIERGNYV